VHSLLPVTSITSCSRQCGAIPFGHRPATSNGLPCLRPGVGLCLSASMDRQCN